MSGCGRAKCSLYSDAKLKDHASETWHDNLVQSYYADIGLTSPVD